jgi:predicted ATPase/DNA-binding winged helix-turn-helix (wHTH) protein
MQRADRTVLSTLQSDANGVVLRLGRIWLHTDSGELRADDGMMVRPRRKLGQLLQLLGENPDRLLTRAELMQVLWPKRSASEESLTQLIREARVALRDEGGTLLQTMHGRGYMLAASVLPVRLPPGPVSSFVGRQRQLDTLRQWVLQHRLVTLTGPGGVGKTRLMAELAARFTAAERARLVRIDLAPVIDGTDLPALLANRIGVGAIQGTATEAAQRALRDRSALLLIDNAEHLVAPLVTLLRSVLTECPGVCALVTSRVTLAIPEERVFRLAPLAVPPPSARHLAEVLDYGAVQLLIDRATAQMPDFDPAAQDPQVIAAICRKLDGLALAIEMAAPLLQLLTPAQLLERLGRRLHLQAPSTAVAPARQRSLSAMLNWSWELLAPFERHLLQALATFAGSAPLDLLAEVVGVEDWQAMDGMAGLVRASLATGLPGGEQPRFGMLETTRAFALEQAGSEAVLLRAGHFGAILRKFEAADRDWPTMASADWQLRHGADADNVRAALHWAFGPGGALEGAIKLVSVSHSLWLELDELPLREARHWFGRATECAGPATPPEVLARLDLGLSWPDDQLGDLATLPPALRAATRFRQLGDRVGTGAALWRAGCALLVAETLDQAGEHLAEAGRELRTILPTKWLILTLVRLASVRVMTRQDEEALATFQEALSMARTLGYPYGAMLCGHALGDHLFTMGRRDEALFLLTTLRDELPRGLRSQLVSNLATQLAAVHRTGEAMDAIAEILGATPVTGLSATLARGLETLAMLVAEAGDPAAAALLFGHVLTVHPAQRKRSGGRLEVHRRLTSALQAAGLAGQAVDEQLARGAGLSEAQVTELATSLLIALRGAHAPT